MSTSSQKIFQVAGALLAWLAVVIQFYLIIKHRNYSIPITILRFFSFFTILTNILVAITFTKLANTKSSHETFAVNSKVFTAVAVYITIVGLIYNVILRFLWKPVGLQMLVDELLHTINPLFYIAYWCLFVVKGNLQWKDVYKWLLYPFFYLIFILVIGAFTKLYPYPFIDVEKLGYQTVALNCCYIFFLFVIMSYLFVGINKLMGKANQ